MPDQISIQYLNSKILKRISGNDETYTAKNNLIYECKNNAKVSWAEVSDVLTLFPHLALDERYALVCYVYHHYHGVNGKVVAVPKTSSFIPDVKSPGGFNGFWGPIYSVSEDAVPPMEVIYTDGTPEGYFESIMAANTIPNMMLNDFKCTRSHSFIAESPADFPVNWKVYISLTDWRPRIVYNHTQGSCTLYIVDNQDTIFDEDSLDPKVSYQLFLRSYTFRKTLDLETTIRSNKRIIPVSENHITDNSRYTEYRRCAIPQEQSILLASKTVPYLL